MSPNGVRLFFIQYFLPTTPLVAVPPRVVRSAVSVVNETYLRPSLDVAPCLIVDGVTYRSYCPLLEFSL